VERLGELRTTEWGEGPPVDRLSPIRRRFADLRPDASTHAVDAIVVALRRARGEPQVAALIHELLSDGLIDRVRGSSGFTLRYLLVDTLLELGFPHALEVRPEDLELLRAEDRPTERGSIAGGFTLAVATGSLMWIGLAALFSLARIDMDSWMRYPWPLIPLAVAALHAVLSIRWSARAIGATGHARQAAVAPLKRLGWAGLFGPVCSFMAWLIVGHDVLAAGLITAAPSMLTAALCGLTASRIEPERRA
jgi:hypothetical protein